MGSVEVGEMMPMPGGGAMSMMWMRMPGQTWPGAATSFLCMWVVMMVAMMLPVLMPMLWRYRQVVTRTGDLRAGSARAHGGQTGGAWAGGAKLGGLIALVGGGYFFVWTLFGMAVFPLGAALATLEMQQPQLARAVPTAVGVVVLIVGFLQLTAWKARQLSCCRAAPGRCRTFSADAGTAWRHGLNLGLQCSRCCGGLMVIPLVVGVMDLGAMTVVTAAITVERLAPAGQRVARAIGVVVVGAGLVLIVRAAGPG
jgi:predicted metal-binding membrane protein